ncbi:hypothetical protein [Leptospira noguchii]|uniref:hypothetical protein n=1 Tax=Leptospira noguchii TaxID=28182 RepID=UPI0018DEE77C|nr:hypothetical protein [Leptospira noguchii]
MERKRTTQRLASMVARRVASHFNYEICELRRRPIGSRCIEFIIRPIFLRRTHVKLLLLPKGYVRLLGFFKISLLD